MLVRVALVGLGWLAIYAALTALGRIWTSFGVFIGNVVYLLPVAVAAGLAIVAAQTSMGRMRAAWSLLAASTGLWLGGEVTWTIYAYLAPSGAPIPSAADVGYIGQYVLALPAIVIGLGVASGLGRTRGLLDALLITMALAAIGWHLIAGPLASSAKSVATVVTFIYPAFAGGIFGLLLLVLASSRRKAPTSIVLAGVALGVSAVGDAGYAYQTAHGGYQDDSWLNLLWQAEAVLLCVAAVAAVRDGREHRYARFDRDLVFVPVLAVAALAATELEQLGRLGVVPLTVTVLLVIGLLARQAAASRDRALLARQLQTAADTDPLTGLANRRFFEREAAAAAETAARQGTPVSIILLDLDRFKEVNDTWGHPTGDAVLAVAAARLGRALRAGDLVARYGGEEFICLLPGANERAATAMAERLRMALSGAPVIIPDRRAQVTLTASLGVATATPTVGGRVDIYALIDAADAAVYQAKAAGRDRVTRTGTGTGTGMQVAGTPQALVWLADQIDAASGDTGHSATVSRLARLVAARLGCDEAMLVRVGEAARIHNVGKIGVPQTTLAKRGQLDPHESAMIRRHPKEGARLAAEVGGRPDLAAAIAAHHERHDGHGYPDGLADDQIPLEAKIIAVCDAWAIMRAPGRRTPCLSTDQACEQITRGRASSYDPAVADALLALVEAGYIDEGDRGARRTAYAAADAEQPRT